MHSVTDYLSHDHRRLDAIFEEVERLAAAGSFAEAVARFAEFAGGLGKHIDREEQILFPAFEAGTGMSGGGPTTVMRVEHILIRRVLGEIRAALDGKSAADAARSARELEGVLKPHNMKEEQILYPMSDQVAGGDAERRALVERMQAL